MDNHKTAERILQFVGGKKNIRGVTHCFTRLRFQLVNSQEADREQLLQTEGVISVVESSGQYQVVLGNKVEKVYEALILLIGDVGSATISDEKTGIGNKILNTVAAIFTPTVPAIAASGMLKGILAVAVMIASSFYQTDIKVFDTYIILNAASDALFYFMPIILGYSAAKVFKANEYIAMIIGATLCYPAIVGLMTGEEAVSLFGVSLTKASYTSSVIPIIIAVFILAYVQRFLDKTIPEVLKIIMVPTLSLLVMIPATLLFFGPVGIYLGNFVNWLYYYIMNFSPILLGAFVGGIWCVLVIFGAHRAIVPIGINDVAQTGRQNLLAFAGAANFAQAGAAMGVFLKTKNKGLKTVAASATVTALFGITEPAIYGANLRLKKPMICGVIFGALAGALMGWGGSYGTAFANQGLLTIPVYADAGTKAFVCYLLGIAIAFFGSCFATIVVGFKDLPNEEETSVGNIEAGITEAFVPEKTDIKVLSPVKGKIVPLSELNDEVFASKALGEGIAVYPIEGVITAPMNCRVSVLYPTLHAIGLELENGIEMLIHIGIDTVELQGKHFEAFAKAFDQLSYGDKIVGFDVKAIEAAGYDPIVAIIITNSGRYQKVGTSQSETVEQTDELIFLRGAEE